MDFHQYTTFSSFILILDKLSIYNTAFLTLFPA